jgi:hypothetical protein
VAKVASMILGIGGGLVRGDLQPSAPGYQLWAGENPAAAHIVCQTIGRFT